MSPPSHEQPGGERATEQQRPRNRPRPVVQSDSEGVPHNRQHEDENRHLHESIQQARPSVLVHSRPDSRRPRSNAEYMTQLVRPDSVGVLASEVPLRLKQLDAANPQSGDSAPTMRRGDTELVVPGTMVVVRLPDPF